MVGGLFREPLHEAKKLLKGEIQPHARRRSAEQIVIPGKDAPDLAGVLHLRHADLKIGHGDALAQEHAIDVVVGLHKELCRIRERLVLGEPSRLRVPVRADDGQILDLRI
jgi:hypothetical protein